MQTLCFQRRPIQCIQNSNCDTFVFDPVEPGPLQQEHFDDLNRESDEKILQKDKIEHIIYAARVGFCQLWESNNSGAAVDESLCNTPRVNTSSSNSDGEPASVHMWVKDQEAPPETKCYKGSLLKDFGKTFSQQDIFLKKVCSEMAYANSECYGRVVEGALVTTGSPLIPSKNLFFAPINMLPDEVDRVQAYEQHNLNVFNRQARYKLDCRFRTNQTVIRDELEVVDCYRRLRVNIGSYVNNLGIASALSGAIVMAFNSLDGLFGIGSPEPAQPKQCRRIAVAFTITILGCLLYLYLLASSQGIDLYEVATRSKPITKWSKMDTFKGLDSSRLANPVQTRRDTLHTCYSVALLIVFSFWATYLQAYRGKLASFWSTFLVEMPWFCCKRPLYGTDRWGVVVRLFRQYASVHPEVKVRRNELVPEFESRLHNDKFGAMSEDQTVPAAKWEDQTVPATKWEKMDKETNKRIAQFILRLASGSLSTRDGCAENVSRERGEEEGDGKTAKPKRKRKTKTKTKATEEGEGGSVARTGDDDDDDGDGDDGDDVDYDVDDDESGGGSKTKKKTAGKSPQEPAALAFLPVLDMEAHLSHFRELELDVFQVLGREVVMDKLDTMNKTEVDQQSTFELPTEATLLLLRDLRRKLQRGLHPPKSTPWGTTKHSQTAGFALLLAKDAAEVASWSLEMIPRLCKLLETTVSNFSGIIDEHDGMNDVSMFVDEEKAPVWAETFDLLLRVFQLIISWRGFGRSTAKEAMLNSGLAAIASRLGDDDDDDDDDGEETEAAADGAATSLATRCNKAFQYFHAQGDFIPTAEVFETYLQLLGTLWDIADAEGTHSDGIATKIAGACDGALKRGWSVDEKKPIKPNLLQSILTAFLKYSKSPLMSVSAIVKTGMQELVESAKTSASDDGVKGGSKEKSTALSSKTFATLTKSTFPCYHRTVLAKLVEIVSNGHMHESLNLLTETHFERDMEIMVTDNLGKMEHCFANFKFLLECVRHESLQNRSILIPTFRLGAKFVDAFQKKCMPLLEAQFRQHSSEIVALLKTVQQATRSLQRLCSHFKDEKRDEKLTSFVPALKRSLETLVFRTKAMLVNNNCRDAIIIGNLKNKDFSKGQIVSSQVPLTANTEDEDEDEDEDMGSDVGSDLNAEDGEA